MGYSLQKTPHVEGSWDNESLKAILYLLVTNEIEDIDPIIERTPLFEILSGIDHQSIPAYAESILYHINQKE